MINHLGLQRNMAYWPNLTDWNIYFTLKVLDFLFKIKGYLDEFKKN